MTMLGLFPKVDPKAFRSDRLFIHPVEGDAFAPTLQRDRDCVVVAPADRYLCEGVYLLGDEHWQDLYRCERRLASDGAVWMGRDNKIYSDQIVTAEWFEEHVLGFVVANIVVTNEVILRRVTT